MTTTTPWFLVESNGSRFRNENGKAVQSNETMAIYNIYTNNIRVITHLILTFLIFLPTHTRTHSFTTTHQQTNNDYNQNPGTHYKASFSKHRWNTTISQGVKGIAGVNTVVGHHISGCFGWSKWGRWELYIRFCSGFIIKHTGKQYTKCAAYNMYNAIEVEIYVAY